MILTSVRVPADLSALYGRHVRLRLNISAAKPTTRHSVGDEFGILIDIGSSEFLVLQDRHDPGVWRPFRAEGYIIDPYPMHRAHVFFYPYNDENFWTWCREIGGDVLDSYSGLDRYDNHAEAFQAAREWLEKQTARDATRRVL